MKEEKLVIGLRETSRMIKQNRVKSVILADDTDEPLRMEILALCSDKQIPVESVRSKRKLGHSFGIERPAAVIAYLN